MNNYPWYPTSTSSNIAAQSESSYENYNKTKEFADVGYFLQSYVVAGGVVTENVTRNDTIDATTVTVSLNNNIMSRAGESFSINVASTTYYLDFTSAGDWSWGTAHASGVSGTDYLPIASVTSDSNKNVASIVDSRGTVGGFNLKTSYDNFVKKGDYFYNVKDFGAKGDGVTDDTAEIQSAVDAVVATGGVLFFPIGNYSIYNTISFNTSNVGKRFVIAGAGIGVTNIIAKADITVFSGEGYLYEITNMSINKSFTGTSTKYGIYCTGGGRRVLSLLQISGFNNSFRQDGSFDMFSIDKCTFVDSVNDGAIININDSGSCALLSITDSLFNTNGGNGFTLQQTSGQLINFKVSNTEFINNTKHAFYAESTTGQPITGIMIDSCDFEHVKTGYSGIRLKQVYKIMIENCAFNVFDSNAEAVIYLDNCKDGVIQSPWFADTITTPNKVFVSQTCDSVYLIGSRQSALTKIGFTTTPGLPVPITCLNIDDVYKLFQKQYFMMGPQYNTNDLTRVVLQGVYTAQMPTDVQSRVTIPFNSKDNTRQIAQIQIVWFNNSAAILTGNVVWTVFNSSNEGVSPVFSNATVAVGGYRVYQTTTITVGSLPYDPTYGVTPLAILRNGTDAADTFTGDACLVAVRLIFK